MVIEGGLYSQMSPSIYDPSKSVAVCFFLIYPYRIGFAFKKPVYLLVLSSTLFLGLNPEALATRCISQPIGISVHVTCTIRTFILSLYSPPVMYFSGFQLQQFISFGLH
jgi:hypothetical protein